MGEELARDQPSSRSTRTPLLRTDGAWPQAGRHRVGGAQGASVRASVDWWAGVNERPTTGMSVSGRNDFYLCGRSVMWDVTEASRGGVLAVLMVFLTRRAIRRSRPSRWTGNRSHAAWGLTSWASRLAGSRRDTGQWRAHLAGDPENGIVLTRREQRRYAWGFLVAAVRYRLHDALGEAWRPVDWMLSSRSRREAFIAAPPGMLVVYVAAHDGMHTLLTDGRVGMGDGLWRRHVCAHPLASARPGNRAGRTGTFPRRITPAPLAATG